jgi:hypothetical protein
MAVFMPQKCQELQKGSPAFATLGLLILHLCSFDKLCKTVPKDTANQKGANRLLAALQTNWQARKKS